MYIIYMYILSRVTNLEIYKDALQRCKHIKYKAQNTNKNKHTYTYA